MNWKWNKIGYSNTNCVIGKLYYFGLWGVKGVGGLKGWGRLYNSAINTVPCSANAVLDSSTGFKEKHQVQDPLKSTKKWKMNDYIIIQTYDTVITQTMENIFIRIVTKIFKCNFLIRLIS